MDGRRQRAEITFDHAKDAGNRAKHGVSPALAADPEWDTALIRTDDREDYGEERQRALFVQSPGPKRST